MLTTKSNTPSKKSTPSLREWPNYLFEFLQSKKWISAIDPDPELRLSPENGNVAFASTDMNWCFTLRSFAQMYADAYDSACPLHNTLFSISPT
jgi:hypothetical protein